MNTIPPIVRGLPALFLLSTLILFLSLAGCGGGGGSPNAASNDDDRNGSQNGSGGEGSGNNPDPPPAPVVGSLEFVRDGNGNLGEAVAFTEAGGWIWSIGERLHRSADGISWQEVTTGTPEIGTLERISGVVRGASGRYIAYGTRFSSCTDFGYQGCLAKRALIYLSDDGTSWQRITPPEMAPPIGSNASLKGMIADPDGGYLALGEISGPEWFVRLWHSPDGEDWTQVEELRSEEGQFWGRALATDGKTVVLGTIEVACSKPVDLGGSIGWAVGSLLVTEPRIFVRRSGSTFSLQTPEQLPIPGAGHTTPDCSTYIEESAWNDHGHLDVEVTTAGGTIVLSDPNQEPKQLYRYANGTWQPLGGAPASPGFIVAEEEAVGYLAYEQSGGIYSPRAGSEHGSLRLTAFLLTDDGWVKRTGNRIYGAGVGDARWFEGRLFVSTRTPVGVPVIPGLAGRIWYSLKEGETGGDACILESGASCTLFDFERHPDYSDFGDIDLSMGTFDYADFGDSNLREANFDGASLIGSYGDYYHTLEGASFRGADLRASQLDLSGADLGNADLTGALVLLSAPPADLTGAITREATFRQDFFSETFTLSLTGLDLTDARIEGANRSGAPRLRIDSLRGTTLGNTRFSNVDLTGADITGIDLSQMRLDDNSICPDGQPPVDDGRYKSCVREE